ncbi:MAG TPA: hypothetical protein VFP78_05870, partial [Solirubrobacteraceae bacterium]|nr:hypothetical protein [Solirubrobacteraceae bacterium]
LPLYSEQLAGGWGKLATAAVVLVAGAGAAGVGSQVVSAGPDTDRQSRPALERHDAGERTAAAPADAATRPVAASTNRDARGDRAKGADRRETRTSNGGTAPRSTGGSDGAANNVPAATGGGGGGGGGALGGGALGGVTPPAGTDAPNVLPAAPQQVDLPIPPPEAPKIAPELTAPAIDGGGTTGALPAPVQETVDDTVGAVEGATGVDLP